MRQELKITRYIVVASVLSLSFSSLCFSAELSAKLVMFPGKTTSLKSPDGLHAVTDVDKGPKPDGEQQHELYLRKTGAKGKVYLLSFNRCVDVGWRPDSTAFVVNDFAGCDLVNAYVYYIKDLKHRVDVSSCMLGAITDKKDKLNMSQSDNLYVSAVRWINADALEVRVQGYGGKGGGFTIFYEWDLKNKFKKLRRVDD